MPHIEPDVLLINPFLSSQEIAHYPHFSDKETETLRNLSNTLRPYSLEVTSKWLSAWSH